MNIFIIETALQMINAEEALKHFKTSNNILVVLNRIHYPQNLITSTISKKTWDNIIYVNFHDIRNEYYNKYIKYKVNEYKLYFASFLNRTKLNIIAKKYKNADKVFIGNYFKLHMRHFAYKINAKECILLDDGTDILRVAKKRKEKKEIDGLESIKDKLHNIIHGFISSQLENVIFFSSFDVEVLDGDKLIRNNYKHLKQEKKSNVKLNINEILFLGQCLVDDYWVEKEVYIKYLCKVKEYYKNENLIYIKHPRESHQIVDYIKKRLDIEIVAINVPAEIYILKYTWPKEVSSFFCSAIENIRNIFNDDINITCFEIKNTDLLCCKDFVKNLYQNWHKYTTSSFKVIRL